MLENQQRRQFLQASLAGGAILGVGGANATHGDVQVTVPVRPRDTNPPAAPGRVRWHDDFATARTASGRSGKPVFLFQMLGRLDEKFC